MGNDGRRPSILVLAATALVSCASPEQTAGSGSSSGPGTASQATLGPVDAVRTLVVGDEASAADPAWPEFFVTAVADEGIPMTVRTVAEPGAGFAGSPAFAGTVEQAAEGSTQLVVLFDSRLETDDADELAEAARRAFVEVERAAPDARLVVVGPVSGTVAGSAARDALMTEALDAGATYVDPVADGWAEDAGPEELSRLLRPHIEELVGALAASGANR